MNKPVSSKLFKLKKWLTLPDAAKHLTGVCNEEITEADILRLALDGHLKLSVNFVNYTKARCGNVIGSEDVEWIIDEQWIEFRANTNIHSPYFLVEKEGKPSYYKYCEQIDDIRFLNLSDEVTTITDVWDLPMIGGERLDIEHKYQGLTGGPALTLQNLNGAFVESRDGVMCQLQERFTDDVFHDVFHGIEETLKQRIADNEINGMEPEKALGLLNEFQSKSSAKKRSQPKANNYFPAPGLPQDSVLGVCRS